MPLDNERGQPMQPHDYPPDLVKLLAEQQARIEWLEQLVHGLIWWGHAHSPQLERLWEAWPYNPAKKEKTNDT